ncbi:MAG: RnfABCDGE type electron transport complex subunit B [Acidobacteria bacterium]|nr:RnfABCDGE type electron transport complex subunit B [Acidobacteriota bacterium]
MDTVLTSIAALGGLTLALGTVLAAAARLFYVDEDPRIDMVDGMLPQANCGACGFPGCRAFAEALVSQKSEPVKCTVSSDLDRQNIASYLGVAAGTAHRKVARLACAGGTNAAYQHALYRGLSSCRAASMVGGAGKSCSWGCLGLGDCQVVCNFNAIHMSPFRLPVVHEARCTACGDCVDICPKDLFSLQTESRRLWVACKSQEEGDRVLEVCEVGCTACGKCAMDAPDLVHMDGPLPVIDMTLPHSHKNATERCPTGAMLWMGTNGPEYGAEAPRLRRKEALPPRSA